MAFKIQPIKKKSNKVYKSIYIPKEFAEKVAQLASENNTSFNNVIINMMEYCLTEISEQTKPEE